jgi:hypothetical protein
MPKARKWFILIILSSLFLGGGGFSYWYFVMQSQETVNYDVVKKEYLAFSDSLDQIDLLIHTEEDAALLTLHKDRKTLYQQKIESIRKQMSGASAKELTLPSTKSDDNLQNEWMKNLAIIGGIAALILLGIVIWIMAIIRKKQEEIEEAEAPEEPKTNFRNMYQAIEDAQKRLAEEGKIPTPSPLAKQTAETLLAAEDDKAPVIPQNPLKATPPKIKSSTAANPAFDAIEVELAPLVKPQPEIAKPFKSIPPPLSSTQKRPFSQTGSFILRAEDLGIPPTLPTTPAEVRTRNPEVRSQPQNSEQTPAPTSASTPVNDPFVPADIPTQTPTEVPVQAPVTTIPTPVREAEAQRTQNDRLPRTEDEHKVDVLKLARRGYTSSEIARRLKVSQDQVDFVIRLARERGE